MADEALIWDTFDNQQPLSRPKCGFTGLECPPEFIEKYLAVCIVAAVIILLTIVGVVGAIAYAIR